MIFCENLFNFVTNHLLKTIIIQVIAKDYIPRGNGEFDTFQLNIAKAVVANGTAWKIPADEVTALQSSSTQYGNLYKIISNKNNRTKSQVDAYNNFRKTYESDLRLFVNGFMRSNKNVPSSILSALGIKQRGRRRKQRSQIITAPIVFIHTLGSMRLKFLCRIESHIGKASIHPEADGIELRYIIGSEPQVAAEKLTHHFSKKAKFMMEFGDEHRGKKIYVYARWKNEVHEWQSGPWCRLVEAVIY